MRCLFACILCFGLVAFFAPPATAEIIELADGNSLVRYDSQRDLGVFTWLVNGQNQLFQQWFWYRVGDMGGESPISDLTDLGTTSAGLSFATAHYAGSGFTVDITYSLPGGAPGSTVSGLGEQIRITNTGATALPFHFFQYSDFDQLGTADNDSAAMLNTNTIRQTDAVFSAALQETVETPPPDQWAISAFSTVRDSLTDASPTTLGNTVEAGQPHDVQWAFQWDRNIAPASSFNILRQKSLDITAVPEPASLLLIGGALLLFPGLRRLRFNRG